MFPAPKMFSAETFSHCKPNSSKCLGKSAPNRKLFNEYVDTLIARS